MNELFELGLADNGRDVLFTQPSPIHGRGLFVNETIPQYTILCRRLGLRAPLSLRDKRAMIGIDGLDPAIPEDQIFKNINHSCRPSACLSDTGCLLSLEKIQSGSEITVDYDVMLSGSGWNAICTCGCPGCRLIIQDEANL